VEPFRLVERVRRDACGVDHLARDEDGQRIAQRQGDGIGRRRIDARDAFAFWTKTLPMYASPRISSTCARTTLPPSSRTMDSMRSWVSGRPKRCFDRRSWMESASVPLAKRDRSVPYFRDAR